LVAFTRVSVNASSAASFAASSFIITTTVLARFSRVSVGSAGHSSVISDATTRSLSLSCAPSRVADASEEDTANDSTTFPSLSVVVATYTETASLPPSLAVTFTVTGATHSPKRFTVMTTWPSPSPTRASLVAIATNGPCRRERVRVRVDRHQTRVRELLPVEGHPHGVDAKASTDPSDDVGHVTLAPSAPSAPGRIATGSNPSTPRVRMVVTFVICTSSSSMGFP
jgi:hypothetical protein